MKLEHLDTPKDRWPEELNCPACRGELPRTVTSNQCEHCGLRFGLVNGVFNFMIDGDEQFNGHNVLNRAGDYAGQERLPAITADAAKIGWFQAVRHHLADDYRDVIMSMVDTTRLAWIFHCYKPEASRSALVLGSHWGTLPTMLCPYYDTVYSVQDEIARLQFQVVRAQSDNIPNLILLRSTSLQLPLKDDSTDLIVLNGTLSWLGSGQAGLSRRERQSAILEECRRVLSPNGVLYVGASNRFGLRIGRDSSELGAEGGHDYSLRGYRNLFKEAGFDQLESYWCWPNYREPRMSGPMDGQGMIYLANKQKDHLYNSWARFAISLITKLPSSLIGFGLRLFAPTFMFFVSGSSTKSISGKANISDDGSNFSKQSRSKMSLQELALAREKAVDSYVRLTLSQDARLRTTYLLLKNKAVSKAVRISVESTIQSESEGVGIPNRDSSQTKYQFHLDESEGVQGRLFKPSSKEDIRAAGCWLGDFQQSTARGTWCADKLQSEMNCVIKTTSSVWAETPLVHSIDSFVDAYMASITSSPPSIVQEHGDFTLPNLMFSTDEQLEVIDWEHSRQEGHPLMDVGALFSSFLRRGSNRHNGGEVASHSAISWFMEGFLCTHVGGGTLPIMLAPVYYTLRVIDRVITFKPLSDPATYLEVQETWLPLLTLGLDYFRSGPTKIDGISQ